MFYEELARNWLDHGVYGLFIHGQLIPVDMRVPGYPAFLSAIYAVLRRTRWAVMAVQVAVDLATCLLTAELAALIVPASVRTRVATIALWMAALCPFTANYAAAVLTETLATFLTTAALLVLVCIAGSSFAELPLESLENRGLLSLTGWWLFAGLLVGVGTLVRPETPLLLAAAGLVLVVRWRRRADWSKLALAGLWMGVGLLAVLAPWASRNARTLGRVEFLAPRYAESYGDFIPVGFHAWTRTWMVRFRDAYAVTWKLGKERISIASLPDSAFDSEAERARVSTLFEQYNRDLNISPLLDRDFAKLADERTARRPLRTYIFIPLSRALRIWFTPRIELLPYSGRLLPPGEQWRNNPADFGVTAGYAILNMIFVGLACVGAWRCRRLPVVALVLTFLVVRTAFLTQLHTVEPRYVIVCYPAILALAAAAWIGVPFAKQSSPAISRG